MAKAPDMAAIVTAARAGGNPAGTPKKRPGSETPATPTKKNKKARKGNGKKEGEEAGKKEGGGDGYGGQYPDKLGVLGPNKLPRMEGGNPAGAVCSRWKAGKCHFATCPFRHSD